MVTPSAGTVILVRFPFSELSQLKLRPAVVLVPADRGDWILCNGHKIAPEKQKCGPKSAPGAVTF